MFGLPTVWLVSLAGLAVAVLLTASHYQAYQSGRETEQAAMLKRAVEAYQNREDIDNEVDALDLVDVCLSLGGSVSDCTVDRLRRLEETAPRQ